MNSFASASRIATARRKWIAPFVLLVSAVWAGASQACTYTFLAQTRPAYARHSNGYTVALQADWYQKNPTVHIVINGQYQGNYYIPVYLFDGQLTVTMRSHYVNGALKLQAALGVCASGWTVTGPF
jgi:hypothetical protein